MHGDGTSLRPRRDLYKKARWQPVVPEPRPAFICTFLSIFRADQKTSRNQFARWRTWALRDAEIFLSHGWTRFYCHRRCRAILLTHSLLYELIPLEPNALDFPLTPETLIPIFTHLQSRDCRRYFTKFLRVVIRLRITRRYEPRYVR